MTDLGFCQDTCLDPVLQGITGDIFFDYGKNMIFLIQFNDLRNTGDRMGLDRPVDGKVISFLHKFCRFPGASQDKPDGLHLMWQYSGNKKEIIDYGNPYAEAPLL